MGDAIALPERFRRLRRKYRPCEFDLREIIAADATAGAQQCLDAFAQCLRACHDRRVVAARNALRIGAFAREPADKLVGLAGFFGDAHE